MVSHHTFRSRDLDTNYCMKQNTEMNECAKKCLQCMNYEVIFFRYYVVVAVIIARERDSRHVVFFILLLLLLCSFFDDVDVVAGSFLVVVEIVQ